MRYIITFFVALFGFTSVIFAFEDQLSNVYQEQRAKEIFKSLKCAVCNGQSVQDSESEFAKSVRQLVREKISGGASDEQVYDILKSNYGEQIMFRPSWKGETVLLWLLPFVLTFAGFILVILTLRRNKIEVVS